jgi:hypothetical protein
VQCIIDKAGNPYRIKDNLRAKVHEMQASAYKPALQRPRLSKNKKSNLAIIKKSNFFSAKSGFL